MGLFEHAGFKVDRHETLMPYGHPLPPTHVQDYILQAYPNAQKELNEMHMMIATKVGAPTHEAFRPLYDEEVEL